MILINSKSLKFSLKFWNLEIAVKEEMNKYESNVGHLGYDYRKQVRVL